MRCREEREMSRPGYDMELEHPQGIQMSHVFLIVLALHVLVIGGALGYHWMRGRLGDEEPKVASQEKTAVAPEGAGPKVAFRTGGFEPASERPLPLEERRVRPVDRETTALDAVRLAHVAPAPAPAEKAGSPGVVAPVPLALEEAPAVVAAAPAKPKAVAPQPVVAQAVEHVVGKGDMLGKIAKRHGVTVAALKEANGLQNDLIRIGQKLKVPSAPVPAPQAQAPAAMVAQAPATPGPTMAQQAASAAPAADPGRVYVVSKGDTLWGISRRFKMAPEQIAKANRISDPGRLRVGMKLVIPTEALGTESGQKKPREGDASKMAMSG